MASLLERAVGTSSPAQTLERPTAVKNKHKTIVKFAGAILGDEFNSLVNDYDFMRRKRHKFIYEPDIPCSMKEAKDAIITAEKFVNKIAEFIRQNFPQQEPDF